MPEEGNSYNDSQQSDIYNRSVSQNSLENYKQLVQPTNDQYYPPQHQHQHQQQPQYQAAIQYQQGPPQPQLNYAQYSQPQVDPSLASILSRPPAGTKPVPMPQYQGQYQGQYQAQYQPQYPQHGYSNENLNYSDGYNTGYDNIPRQQQQQAPVPAMNFSKSNSQKQPGATGNSQQFFKGEDPDAKLSLKARKAKEYQIELNAQIRAKQEQKLREKEAEARLDEKRARENANYDPYGKGGAGAPIKDLNGDNVANLKRVDPSMLSPRDLSGFQQQQQQQQPQPQSGFQPQGYQAPQQSEQGAGYQTNRDANDHARRNDLFGDPKVSWTFTFSFFFLFFFHL